MNWELAKTISATIQSVAAAAAVIGGAVWGYFRFVRFRTLKPRLEFSFDWSCADDGETKSVAILTLRLRNPGNAKVDLRREKDEPRCFLKYALITADLAHDALSLISLPVDELEHLDTVFLAHKWIEPSEAIDDVKILHIQRQGVLAAQFEVVIYGAQKWSASAAFPLLGANMSSKSEDEQDQYQETEAVKEGLKNSLARARRALKHLAGDDKTTLEGIIQETASLLGSLGSGLVGSHLLGEAKRLKRELDKYLR
jgi:hypothetical protein